MQMVPSELGARIKHARLQKRLSQEEVETQTGVDHSQQSRIERGDFKRYGSNVQKLCKFFDLPPTAGELDTLRVRLERAVLKAPTRRALEAVLDAIDAGAAPIYVSPKQP